MTDPAVAYQPNTNYIAYDQGKALDIYLKNPNGTDNLGVVWPGVTVFPGELLTSAPDWQTYVGNMLTLAFSIDWFHPKIQQYWSSQFQRFYDPATGIDIDGVWIDMNEPANFCNLPCDDPFQQAIDQQMPPKRTTAPPPHDAPIFTNTSANLVSRFTCRDDFLNPPYAINNAAPTGQLSSKTASVSSTVHSSFQLHGN